MKLIVDMNMSTKWAVALREAGFEALHWSDLGDAESSDDDIMAYALANDAIVLTRDMDFSAILAANRLKKPSVMHLSDRDRFQPLTVERVVLSLSRFETELAKGAIISMSGGRVRVRDLPIPGVADE
jgi:predicted nuclease of predicted toxin-antitoxin system